MWLGLFWFVNRVTIDMEKRVREINGRGLWGVAMIRRRVILWSLYFGEGFGDFEEEKINNRIISWLQEQDFEKNAQ